MKYLIFTINSFRLALDIGKIVEILIPGVNGNTAPEKMLAEKSLTVQNKQIPIITLADLLFNVPPGIPDDFRIILIELNDKLLGLIVDNADEIILIPEENIKSAEKIAPEIKSDIICGKISEEEKDIYIVAPDKILSVVEAG